LKYIGIDLLGTYIFVAYLPYLVDCKSGKCTQVIDPTRDLKLKGSTSWVGCVALDASGSRLVRA